jgi:hypothetical protein
LLGVYFLIAALTNASPRIRVPPPPPANSLTQPIKNPAPHAA